MAIAVDSVSTAHGNGASPFTLNHTTAGSDRLLIVGVSIHHVNSEVISMTYNGVEMTLVPDTGEYNGQYYCVMYYLVAPATGSNTVSISTSDQVYDIGIGVISLTGVHQSVPLGTALQTTGTSTTPSVTVSSAADELVVDALCINNNGALAVHASQTSRWNATTGNAFIKYAGSTEVGAASTTMSWTNGTSQNWSMAAVPIKPVGAAPPATGVRTLASTGVGK